MFIRIEYTEYGEELKADNRRSTIKTQNGVDKGNNKQELIGDLTPY